jgi:hypothetical protein
MRPGCTCVHLYCASAGGSTSQAGASSAAAAATAGSGGVEGQDDLAELADDPELTAYLQVGSAVTCSNVHCSAVQCITVQYSKVQYSTVPGARVTCHKGAKGTRTTVQLIPSHGTPCHTARLQYGMILEWAYLLQHPGTCQGCACHVSSRAEPS